MEIIRAVTRLIAFSIVAIITVLFTIIARPLPQSAFEKWKNICSRAFAKLSMAIIGVKLQVKGNAPEPPFFLVSNHLSYIDILPLWATCKGTFIAKSEIKSWPFFGFATKTMGVLFIDREENRDITRVNELISESMSDNQGIILFPEGTSTRGERVLQFKSSLLHYPALKNISVSYASISYRTFDETKPAGTYVCWWGDMTFFKHFFELMKLKSFVAEITFGDKEVIHSNRKTLAHTLHQEISKTFTPVIKKE